MNRCGGVMNLFIAKNLRASKQIGHRPSPWLGESRGGWLLLTFAPLLLLYRGIEPNEKASQGLSEISPPRLK